MPDPATPPNPTPPAPTPPAQPAPAPNPPTPPPPKTVAPEGPVLTLADVQQLVTEQTAKLLAERENAWETERVPRLRDQIRAEITTPLEANGLIAALRQELQAADKYIPADDDHSAADRESWGDIAALDPADHATVVRTNADGTKVTRLQVEIARTKAKLLKRKPQHAADVLRTQADAPGTPDEYAEIRAKKLAEEQAARDARKSGLARVFNTSGAR